MNKYPFYIVILIIAFLTSCNDKKVISFELNHSDKGLRFDKYCALVGKDTLKENIVPLDSTIELHIFGLTGFFLENEKAYVGTSMSLKDSSGATLFQHNDIFLDYDTIGFDPKRVKDWVGIYLVTSHPMAKGSSYLWNIRIWDKKGSGEINAEALIQIK